MNNFLSAEFRGGTILKEKKMKKRTKIIVLGSGLVGAPMCLDLAKYPGFEVTAVDINRDALKSLEKRNPLIQTIPFDLSKTNEVRELVNP